MIIHLATAAGPLQVGVRGYEPAAAPARDAGLTGFAAKSAKSAEAAQGHNDCSDDGRKGDCSKHAGKDDYSKDGKGDTYLNPGETLARFDFSHRDFGSHGSGSFG